MGLDTADREHSGNAEVEVRGSESAARTSRGLTRPWWGAGFDVVRRGYDPAQVEEAMDRAEVELRMVTADRDEMVRQEARTQAQLHLIREELDRIARTPLGVEGMSSRLRHMLWLAQQEADQSREAAALQARTIVEQARARARAVSEDADRLARENAETAADRARALVTDAEERAGQILFEAQQQARVLRRETDEAGAEIERRREAAKAEQEELLERTCAEAERIERDAGVERARRDDDLQRRHACAERDFEAAMTARREEAAASLADSEQRRRQAEHRRGAVEADIEQRLAAARRSEEELDQRRRRVSAHLASLRDLLADAPEPEPEGPRDAVPAAT